MSRCGSSGSAVTSNSPSAPPLTGGISASSSPARSGWSGETYSAFTAYIRLPARSAISGKRRQRSSNASATLRPSPSSSSVSRVPARSARRANRRTFAFIASPVYASAVEGGKECWPSADGGVRIRQAGPAPARRPRGRIVMKLPEKGTPRDELLAQMRALQDGDAGWRDGKIFSLVYFAGDDVAELLKDAYAAFIYTNGLSVAAFPSLRKFESEVLAMTAAPLGSSEAAGNMTSGGTESILMAIKTARDWARAQ